MPNMLLVTVKAASLYIYKDNARNNKHKENYG